MRPPRSVPPDRRPLHQPGAKALAARVRRCSAVDRRRRCAGEQWRRAPPPMPCSSPLALRAVCGEPAGRGGPCRGAAAWRSGSGGTPGTEDFFRDRVDDAPGCSRARLLIIGRRRRRRRPGDSAIGRRRAFQLDEVAARRAAARASAPARRGAPRASACLRAWTSVRRAPPLRLGSLPLRPPSATSPHRPTSASAWASIPGAPRPAKQRTDGRPVMSTRA